MALSACTELRDAARQHLLAIARNAIESGISNNTAPQVPLAELPEALLSQRGAFVTLTIGERLRGCVGNLAANQALAQSVADAAHNAAFRDHRFSPLAAHELALTRIEISVLSPTEDMPVANREDLLRQLTPGSDGLVLRDGRCHATFLPKVWEQLPEPESFLAQLLKKAGLPEDHWSDTLQFERYRSTSFTESKASVPRQGK